MYLLDTNALIAALFLPARFGKKTKTLLLSSNDTYYSSVSVFEIVLKHMRGKLKLNLSLQEALGGLNAKQVSFRVEDATETYSLPGLAGHDPFDRMILATARTNGARLITSDRELLGLGFNWILDSST